MQPRLVQILRRRPSGGRRRSGDRRRRRRNLVGRLSWLSGGGGGGGGRGRGASEFLDYDAEVVFVDGVNRRLGLGWLNYAPLHHLANLPRMHLIHPQMPTTTTTTTTASSSWGFFSLHENSFKNKQSKLHHLQTLKLSATPLHLTP